MKKSKYINLNAMRKQSARIASVGATAAILSGCDGTEQVEVITSTFDCVTDTPLATEQCKTAYQKALDESHRSAPRYVKDVECEAEFGQNQCQQNSTGYFIPMMAGYLFANSLWDNKSNRYGADLIPVYRYFRPFSSMHNMLVTADGTIIGEDEDRAYKMKRKSLKRKSLSNIMSRGGFGSYAKKMTSKRSSWGG